MFIGLKQQNQKRETEENYKLNRKKLYLTRDDSTLLTSNALLMNIIPNKNNECIIITESVLSVL